jgi:class 3 adenylate cyclase
MEREIQYCTAADGTRIAFTVIGQPGGTPFLFAPPPPFTNIGAFWRGNLPGALPGLVFSPDSALDRLVCILDFRGCGLSDRQPTDLSADALCSDLEAVVDRLAWDSFALHGMGMSGPVAVQYATEHPERVCRLILRDTYIKASDMGRIPRMRALGAVLRVDWESYCDLMALTVEGWDEPEAARALSHWIRAHSSHEDVLAFAAATSGFDVTDLAGLIAAPTLVLSPSFMPVPSADMARAMVARIPNARLYLYGQDERYDLWPRIAAFLAQGDERTRGPGVASGTAVILFADIAESTALTERLGDTAFRERARDLDSALREVIREAGGTPVEGKLLGDGVLAVFTSARQAIEAALRCGAAGDDGGLPLHLGLHAGDVIEEDGNVFGGAVNIAARVAGESGPGEVLISGTVRELARTSAGVAFEDAGERTLKGISDAVRVWRVREGE